MIHCCVQSCDTNEDVVNCTSVFFVSFPSESSLRAQWLNVVASNGPLRGIVGENTKICSCHFSDESFGKHPVHGYRFLLPTAVPSIFPPPLESILPIAEEDVEPASSLLDNLVDPIVDDDDLVDDESNLISVSDMAMFRSEEDPAALIEAEAGQAQLPAQFVPVDHVLLGPGGSGQVKPPKAIGIEYANGKYYFLQSEDESDDDDDDDELIERVSSVECDATHETIIEEPLEDLTKLDTDSLSAVVAATAGTSIKTEAYFKREQQISVEEEPDHHAMLEEETPSETNSLIEESSSIATGPEFMEIENAGYVIIKKDANEVNPLVFESTGEDELDGEDNKSVITDYGTIEMLDDQSASRERVDKHFCKICHKGFPYESALKKHLFVHSGLKPHVCETCGKSFSQKINLTVHRRRHTGEEPIKKFTCNICQKKCIRMSELKVHVKTHWKKYPHACQLCPERFADITNYYEHIKSMHKNDITLQESIELIAQNENAEVIVQGEDETIPLDGGLYSCAVCLKTFKTERLLKKHKRKLHPKVFVCASCPKQFLYKSLLDKHARVHTQEKPYKCPECDVSFSQKVNLEIHLGKKHNIHMRGGVQRCYVCDFCSKTFDRPSTLQIHVRTHTRERPFRCAQCPKAFVSNSALASHIKTNHRGESILLQSYRRNTAAASADSIILEEQSVTSDVIEETSSQNAGGDEAEDEDIKFIQYSIQFVDTA